MAKRFTDPVVKSVFVNYPKDVRTGLMALREIILEAGTSATETGGVIETLKWGQPAYLPKRPRIGSTVRIDALKAEPGRYAMFYHCQSRLGDMFKQHYPKTFDYDGKRALKFTAGDKLPDEAIRHCAQLALTYHLHKKAL